MKNILSIDTSTKNVSVSFFSGNEILYEKCWISKNNHSIELIDSIKNGFNETNLNQTDFDCIAVAIGPGGFSSIRVGISLSLGLSKNNNLKIEYICTSPEKLRTNKKFDVILNMEIVEHVENIDFFLKSCANLLKKNGIMFIATINKTLKSYIFAIIGAEYILKWLPIGTHEWEKFVKPEDLINVLKKNNLRLEKLDLSLIHI